MSTAPGDISLVAEPGSGRTERLPRSAWIYFIVVAVATAAATLPFLGRLQDSHGWGAFLILGSCALGKGNGPSRGGPTLPALSPARTLDAGCENSLPHALSLALLSSR